MPRPPLPPTQIPLLDRRLPMCRSQGTGRIPGWPDDSGEGLLARAIPQTKQYEAGVVRGTTGTSGRREEGSPDFLRLPHERTANYPDIAVNFRDPLGSGRSMEAIHILRDQPHSIGTRSNSARAIWAGFGSFVAINSRRQLYHSQTSRGSRSNASGSPGPALENYAISRLAHDKSARHYRRKCRPRLKR